MATLVKEWKNVKGYEKFYKVSNYGEVKAKRRVVYGIVDGEQQPTHVTKEKILTPINHGNRYLYISLTDEYGQKKNHYIHRLVAEAFIANPNNLPQVNHLDYDRANNKVTNLEWCSCKENTRYSLCNQPHTHNICFTNTGYKFISIRNIKGTKKYRVSIKNKSFKCDKSFYTLEEALNYRNTVAEEIGIECNDNIN